MCVESNLKSVTVNCLEGMSSVSVMIIFLEFETSKAKTAQNLVK